MNSQRIEILGPVQERVVTKKDTGEQFTLQTQDAALHTPGKKYPEGFEYTLPKGGQPLAPGMYRLADDAVYVGRFRKLDLGVRLVPIVADGSQSAPKAAGARG